MSHVNKGVGQMISGTSTSKRYGQDGSLNGVWCRNLTAAECLLVHRRKKKSEMFCLCFKKNSSLSAVAGVKTKWLQDCIQSRRLMRINTREKCDPDLSKATAKGGMLRAQFLGKLISN